MVRQALGVVILLVGSACGQGVAPPPASQIVGKHDGHVTYADVSPDGKHVVSVGYTEKSVRLWDAATGKEVWRETPHGAYVMYTRFAPDGSAIATVGLEESVALLDPATGKVRRRIEAAGHPYAVTWSRDSKLLATSGMDRTVRVWDAATGKELVRCAGHTARVWGVTFSPDGKTLASCGEDQTVRVWDTTTGRALHSFPAHDSGLVPVAFAPDGKTLATGGGDSTIKLWDAVTGKELLTLRGHGSLVHSVAFDRWGRTLASCGYDDKTVRLWELSTGKQILKLEGHTAEIASVAYASDGLTLISAARDGTVRRWDATGLGSVGRLDVEKMTPARLAAAWRDLAAEDASAAQRAHWTLAARGAESIAYLKANLRDPFDPEDLKRLAQWIRELDHDEFGVRERASHLLGKMGRRAEPALQRALDTSTSAEVRGRVQVLLEKRTDPRPTRDEVRGVRAVALLEQLATPDAVALLEALRKGPKESPLTAQAAAALQRRVARGGR